MVSHVDPKDFCQPVCWQKWNLTCFSVVVALRFNVVCIFETFLTKLCWPSPSRRQTLSADLLLSWIVFLFLAPFLVCKIQGEQQFQKQSNQPLWRQQSCHGLHHLGSDISLQIFSSWPGSAWKPERYIFMNHVPNIIIKQKSFISSKIDYFCVM